MNFAEPNWLFVLLALPLIVVVEVLRRASRRRALEGIISKRVADSVVPGTRRFLWLRTLMRMIGIGAIAVALARPQEGTTLVKEVTKSHDIFLAIDVSKSMLTRDISPNRLQQARIIALDLIEQFPNDRFGIVSFAGSATTSAPLTLDHSAVRETVEQLDTSNIPVGGSELASPIRTAAKTSEEKSLGGTMVVMLTDGEETSEEGFDEETVNRALEQNVQLLVVGIGTDQGDLIPDPDNKGRPVQDRRGNNVTSRLNSEGINKLADQLKGKALFTTSSRTIAAELKDSLQSLETREAEREEQAQATVHFEWPLAIGLLAISLSLLPSIPSRRTSIASAAALMILALPQTAQAESDNLLPAADYVEQGDRAMRNNSYPEAVKNYKKALDFGDELPLSTKQRIAETAAIAAYREEDYSQSAEYFGRALGSGNSNQKGVREYNFANALAMSAEQALAAEQQPSSAATSKAINTLETAVTHYDEALRHKSDYPNAETNKQKVLDRIEELKKQQQQQQQKEEQEREQQENEQQDQQEGEEGQDNENSQNQGEQEQQNQEQEGQDGDESQSSNDEQQGEGNGDEQQEESEGSEQNEGQQNEGDGNEQENAQQGEGSGELDDASSQNAQRVDAASVTAAQLAEMSPEEREKTLAEVRELLRSRAKESKDAPIKQAVPSRRVEKNW